MHMHVSLLLLLLLFPLIVFFSGSASSEEDADPYRWHNFSKLVNVEKGTRATNLRHLKHYFHRFGYLQPPSPSSPANFSDDFDADLESAISSYQRNLGLPVTGKLDGDTVDVITSPRCGLADNHHHLHETRRFEYFSGRPRWGEVKKKHMTLTYAFDEAHFMNIVDYVSKKEVKAVFNRAFNRWSTVIPVNFTEIGNYRTAEIKIGFHKGDHGDGEPFDGVLGILAHAFSPENGRVHLDGDETWAVDLGSEKSIRAVDLESVATHEIGHVLGLAHSSVKGSVMYPILKARSRKVELRVDDVDGVQALYGSNPGFNYGSLVSEESSDCGRGRGRGCRGVELIGLSIWWLLVVMNLI